MMKVLLVDDHPLILTALQTVIRSVGENIVVQGVQSAAAARAVLREDPDLDLVLLDLSLGDDDGFEILAEFRSTWPAVPVVVVSASERSSDVIRAIDTGAMGFVPKSSSHAELHEALRMVMAGAMYVPPSMLGLAFGRPLTTAMDSGDTIPGVMHPTLPGGGMGGDTTPGAFAPLGAHARPDPAQKLPSIDDVGLTPRQTEVLGLLLKGLPNKLIARELNLSVETVKDHVAAVLRALGVATRTQAVLAVSQMTQGQGGWFGPRPPVR
ncbi:MAG: response regulator transcription factor [Rubrivivax sp.]|jgi:DNA-binding NarL/FixJ family response regulator|nr:response regulator transcription factor [Rubrivivax sp.]